MNLFENSHIKVIKRDVYGTSPYRMTWDHKVLILRNTLNYFFHSLWDKEIIII